MRSPFDKKNAFHMGLSDEERLMIDRMSFNYFEFTGRKMKVPPSLADDLKRGGVSFKYLEIDEKLEAKGLSDKGPGN